MLCVRTPCWSPFPHTHTYCLYIRHDATPHTHTHTTHVTRNTRHTQHVTFRTTHDARRTRDATRVMQATKEDAEPCGAPQSLSDLHEPCLNCAQPFLPFEVRAACACLCGASGVRVGCEWGASGVRRRVTQNRQNRAAHAHTHTHTHTHTHIHTGTQLYRVSSNMARNQAVYARGDGWLCCLVGCRCRCRLRTRSFCF